MMRRSSRMKISQAVLQQIIKEEVASLVEAPIPQASPAPRQQARLCELAGLRAEADTEEMPPVRDITRELTPVEFKKELAQQVKIEKYTEKDMLNMWRAWSAEKKKAEEANKPPPPVATALPAAAAEPSLTATQDIDYDPDPTGEEYAKKWKGKEYTESERLFRHFFGKYLDDNNQPTPALKMQMDHDASLKDIVIQLYGWQLPASFRTTSKGHVENYEGPGTDIMKLAQEFESEDKQIEGNEEEFIERLQGYQWKTGKAQMEPLKQARSHEMAVRKALDDVIEKHKKDPRFADLFTPLEGEEGGLPPLAHAGGHDMSEREYAGYIMKIFKDEYEDLYKKHLNALLS
jgi:hypothetical protein